MLSRQNNSPGTKQVNAECKQMGRDTNGIQVSEGMGTEVRSPGVLDTPQTRRQGAGTLTNLLSTEAEAQERAQGTSKQPTSLSNFYSDLPGGGQAL